MPSASLAFNHHPSGIRIAAAIAVEMISQRSGGSGWLKAE